MHLRKKMRQGVSVLLVAAMSLSNAVSSLAAMPTEWQSDSAVTATVQNDTYRASVNLSGAGTPGGLLRSKTKTGQQNTDWNTVSEDMVSGATLLMQSGSNGGVDTEAAINAASTMTTGDGNIGVSGVKLGGDLNGVKSYFMFKDEILCLGAGLNSSVEGTTVITVVDNILQAQSSPQMGLTKPSKSFGSLTNSAWSNLTKNAVQQTDNSQRNWLASSDEAKANPVQWQYVFGNTLTNSNVWAYFPTDDAGITGVQLWVTGDSYQYTMGTAGVVGNTLPPSNQASAGNTVLHNGTDYQAAENVSESVVMLNKWSEEETTVLENSIVTFSLDQPASMMVQKQNDGEKATVTVTVAKADSAEDDAAINFAVGLPLKNVKVSNEAALVFSKVVNNNLCVSLKASEMQEAVVLTGTYEPNAAEGDEITLVRGGESVVVSVPDGFNAETTKWYTRFVVKDEDGNDKYLRNAGWSGKKRELKDGESDKGREAGDTTADHLVNLTAAGNNIEIQGKEKGTFTLVADDGTNKKHFTVKVLYTDPEELPEASDADYQRIIESWRTLLIGEDPDAIDENIANEKITAAQEAWDAYKYKGQDACTGSPWGDNGTGAVKGDFAADAVAQRKAFKKVQAMAYGYKLHIKDSDALLNDITNILDYLCSECYAPKTQANNWYAWEIGVPQDLLPTLILLADELSKDQIERYTEAMYFFQPDPYHGGVIGNATTQGSGYRQNQGSNQVLCSLIAIAMGALRQDNEEVYLGSLSASDTLVIQSIEDSSAIAANGYTSGFYSDGSYLDHKRVPYLGGYGIDFMNSEIEILSMLNGTCWEVSEDAKSNIESYIYDAFGSSMYRGMMLDSLKGRSISRKDESNQGTGRNAMKIILKLIDGYMSGEKQAAMLSALKYWLEQDPEFAGSITAIADLKAKERAEEILNDDSIEPYVAPMHKSFPLMDRAVHRTENYLFAVSMYSERLQNTEIMNSENLMGWHQNNGMTYLYDEDRDQYSDNYWNTVNPLRLPGTTVVPVNIGNGEMDSSKYYQAGDFLSPESWVGGSVIGNYGISGMAMNGRSMANSDNAGLPYASNLSGKKSWFMFENEIVALGAGITNSGMNLPVETTIENHRLGEDGDNAFIVNGKETKLSVREAKLTELLERSVDVSGTEFSDVEWAHLEGNGDSEGVGYYFPTDDTQIQVRRARTTGNWSDIGTSEGESTQNYLEMWVDHGKNPTDAAYSYVLLPETSADEAEEYAADPKVTVLANTAKVQAVYQQELGITGINFWDDEETTLADVTCSGQASVMLQEDEEGHLKVALSDPTMKNTGTITLKISKPVADVIDCDDNVDYELNEEDGSATLTFHMKGTNGTSVNAELHLAASIYPSAVTMKNGGEQAFEVRTFGTDAGTVKWSVAAAAALAFKTDIDPDGVLNVDKGETNGALAVIAELESGETLFAYVSLGRDAAIEADVPSKLPEDMQEIKALIDAALEESDEMIGYDAEAVRMAVKAVQEADREKLAEYLEKEVLALSEAYQITWNDNDMEIGEYVETIGAAEELDPADGTGMVLSLYPSVRSATPSNAVLVIAGTESDMDDMATPSNATPSNATPSNATPSNAAKLNGKDIVSGTLSQYVMKLFKEYENDDDTRVEISMKGLIELVISPKRLDVSKPIVAVVADKHGKQYPMKVTVNDDGTLTILLTRMGTLMIANRLYEIELPDSLVGGTVKADSLYGEEGKEITLTVKADKGYELDYLEVNGEVVEVVDGKYTFELEGDTKVKAVFKKIVDDDDDNDNDDDDNDSDNGYNDDDDDDDSDGGSGSWVSSGGGTKYQTSSGYVKNCWHLINGLWYAFDENGNMRTGWHYEQLDGYWYYLGQNGVMATGWQYINDVWYYFNPETIGVTGWTGSYKTWDYVAQQNPGMPKGAMYRNQMTPDGYMVDDQGAWIQ